MAVRQLLAASMLLTAGALAQPHAGQDAGPPVPRPAYEAGKGPVVAIDEAHKNTHTYSSPPFRGLVELLNRDGYRPRALAQTIDGASLKDVGVLVVCNPGGWEGPDASLSASEVAAVVDWVTNGGSFLFILDHMPGPQNAAGLATALDVTSWHNGYAMVDVPDALPVGNIIFWRTEFLPPGAPAFGPTGPAGGIGFQGAGAVLANHAITEGRSARERVRHVATFVGSAFQPPPGANVLMTMPARAISLTPRTPGAADVRVDAERTPVGGWSQGAALTMGRGRIAIFGEAGLFSAGPAADNRQFVLNVMHWLSRLLR